MVRTGVSYYASRLLRHVKADLEDIQAHNCTYVVHTFSETDFAYYRQTMKKIFLLTHELGMEVQSDPWGIGGVFSGETFSKFIGEHPDKLQVDNLGRTVPAICPTREVFRDYMETWTKFSAEAGADVILWDEPHFIATEMMKKEIKTWACRCKNCQRLYKEKFEEDMPVELTPNVITFRREVMRDFLTYMCRVVHQMKKKNFVVLMPIMDDRYGTGNWEEIAQIPEVDIIGTDPYWLGFLESDPNFDVEGHVRKYTTALKKAADKYSKSCSIWVQAYMAKAGQEHYVENAVRSIYECGMRDIGAWTYYGGSDMSYLCAEDQAKIWDILGQVYAEIRKRG